MVAAGSTRPIRSRDDRFQRLASLLSNRRQRREQGRLLVQGVRPITLALQHGWDVVELLEPEGGRRSQWASSTLGAAGAPVVPVAPALFAELAGKEDPADLLAVVRERRLGLAEVPAGDELLVVACDRPASPGNLGSIVRSADAFGATAVVVTGHAADPFDPASVRASTGSVFSVPVVTAASFTEVAGWAAGLSPRPSLVGADEGAEAVERANLSLPLVLAVGNEGRGLGRAARAACDHLVGIPMRGAASSLNVAAATAVVLYEVDRRRGR